MLNVHLQARMCEFAWLNVCALSCIIPPVFWHSCLRSSLLTVGWARKERNSLLFLYYLSQGHTDIMNTSFCYLEWAVYLPTGLKWFQGSFTLKNMCSPPFVHLSSLSVVLWISAKEQHYVKVILTGCAHVRVMRQKVSLSESELISRLIYW